MTSRGVLAVCVALLVAAIALASLRSHPQSTDATWPSPPSSSPGAPSPSGPSVTTGGGARAAAVPVPVPTVMPAGSAATDAVALPDGASIATLNGVTGRLSLTWPSGRAWSPIVRLERSDTGLWWYVHADGARSTTQWATKDDGSREAMAMVAVPTAAVAPRR